MHMIQNLKAVKLYAEKKITFPLILQLTSGFLEAIYIGSLLDIFPEIFSLHERKYKR